MLLFLDVFLVLNFLVRTQLPFSDFSCKHQQ
jgi:hypothetical protein